MIKNLIARWHAPTPKFWKRIQHVLAALSAAGIAALGIQQAMPLLPATITTWLGYCAGLGTFGAVFIQFMQTDDAK